MSENSNEEEFINEVLKRYNRSRNITKDAAYDNLINNWSKEAARTSSALLYVVVGSSYTNKGDFQSAIKTLKIAAEIDSKIDTPHICLAWVYYKLSLFDMFDRERCQIDLIPVESVSESDLRNGSIGIEIRELLSSGRPHSYETVLVTKGFSPEKCFSLHAFMMQRTFHRDRLWVDKQNTFSHIIESFGLPDVVPVPNYKPDSTAKEILRIAKKELENAHGKTPIRMLGDLILFQDDVIEVFSKRIDDLLKYHLEQE